MKRDSETGRIGRRGLCAFAALACLCACDTGSTSLVPAPRNEVSAAKDVPVTLPSEASKAAARYYSGIQQNLVIQGLLRTDGGGPDTPFTEFQLEQNFIRIGFFEELVFRDGQFRQEETEARLQRWATPVLIELEFSPDVASQTRKRDRSVVEKYAKRLARVTGHPIRPSPRKGSGNFHVAVLSVDGLADFGPRLAELFPNLDPAAAARILAMPRSIYCAVYTFNDPANVNQVGKALAIIRAEHPNLLRDSCYHEEIAQGLGLFNDSPRARPSIFNDDDEFALLTRHDEHLLRLLYDPLLQPGLSADAARPTIRAIISELLNTPS